MQNFGVVNVISGYILSASVFTMTIVGQKIIWIQAWVTINRLLTLFSYFNICNVLICMNIADAANSNWIGIIKPKETIGCTVCVNNSSIDIKLISGYE